MDILTTEPDVVSTTVWQRLSQSYITVTATGKVTKPITDFNNGGTWKTFEMEISQFVQADSVYFIIGISLT